MANDFYSEYQYDRCTSRGICSINPTTSALQEVIFLYLKDAAFCALELEKLGKKDMRIKTLILNTMSVLSSNYEISETNFWMIDSAFKQILPQIVQDYEEYGVIFEKSETKHLITLGKNLNDYIRYGEKNFNRRVKNILPELRNLYRIIFVIVKSLCINILTYESFVEELDEEVVEVYKVFSLFNNLKQKKDELKEIIFNIAKTDCELMKKIRKAQEERYGKQGDFEISFSTTKGKALLVVGSNLYELEQILEEFKDKHIDIYTHDKMILAHTFPAFREYKHLKGQYGQGMENCLLDFSTFPGPIIITRNSLFNVESLYRGRLFTTDIAYSKGVIPIKNNDFSAVIESVNESKGFKTGRKCKSENIGFSLEKTFEDFKNDMSSDAFKKIIIIGLTGYMKEEKEYFNSFVNHIPNDVYTVSLSCCGKENGVCVNASNDIYAMLSLAEKIIKSTNKNVSIFVPFCDRHTLSVIIYLSTFNNIETFIGKWNQTVLRPDILDSLLKDFGVYEMTSPKKDLDKILNL